MVKIIAIVQSEFTKEIIINPSGKPYRDKNSVVINYNGNENLLKSEIEEVLSKYEDRKCRLELYGLEEEIEQLIKEIIKEKFNKFEIEKYSK